MKKRQEDTDKNIVNPQLFADLQRHIVWRQEEKVALFNTLGPLHPGTIDATLRLAEARTLLGDMEGALECTKEAYQARCQVFGQNHSSTIDAYLSLAEAYLNADQPLDAKQIAQDVLRPDFKVEDDEEDLLAIGAKEILAEALQMLQQYKQETLVRRELLQDIEETYGPNHPQSIGAVETLAAALKDSGNVKEALPLYERLLAYMQSDLNAEGIIITLCNLAICHKKLGKLDQSILDMEDALGLAKDVFGEEDDLTRTAQFYYDEITEDGKLVTTIGH